MWSKLRDLRFKSDVDARVAIKRLLLPFREKKRTSITSRAVQESPSRGPAVHCRANFQ